MDGAIGVDRLDLRDQVFLRNVLGQNELLDFNANELCTSRCTLFIGQVGGVLAAADDGQLRGNALFLQRRDARLKLFVHRSGDFFAKQ